MSLTWRELAGQILFLEIDGETSTGLWLVTVSGAGKTPELSSLHAFVPHT